MDIPRSGDSNDPCEALKQPWHWGVCAEDSGNRLEPLKGFRVLLCLGETIGRFESEVGRDLSYFSEGAFCRNDWQWGLSNQES